MAGERHSPKMCCNEQMKIMCKYFAMNFLNLMRQQLKKEMVRKQKDMKRELAKPRKGWNQKSHHRNEDKSGSCPRENRHL